MFILPMCPLSSDQILRPICPSSLQVHPHDRAQSHDYEERQPGLYKASHTDVLATDEQPRRQIDHVVTGSIPILHVLQC